MIFSETDHYWMKVALDLAEHARTAQEIPVGAVLVAGDQLIGQGFNRSITLSDPTAHAEILAIRAASAKLQNYRLPNTVLYTTLEPCLMCAGSLVHARISRVVYGAKDPKAGAIESVICALDQPFLNHQVKHAGGLLSQACGEILSQFFRERRCG